jgi:hypothetical protein
MIEYVFGMGDGQKIRFEIDLDRSRNRTPLEGKGSEWTGLEFHKCTNCTLDPGEYPHCPTSLDIEEIVSRFKAIISHKQANVLVKTPQRVYFKCCDVQNGLSSLLGLVMATSACPILSQMRGLAHHHLPFATEEETLFRAVGAHLVKQYYVARKGGEPDLMLKELENLYRELRTLNECFARRIRAASDLDANINAIVILFTITELVSFSLEDKLEALKPLFFPF